MKTWHVRLSHPVLGVLENMISRDSVGSVIAAVFKTLADSGLERYESHLTENALTISVRLVGVEAEYQPPLTSTRVGRP